MKVNDFYEMYHEDGYCPIPESVDGWEIRKHSNGYTVLSPGTSALELGFRNDGDIDLQEIINFINAAD